MTLDEARELIGCKVAYRPSHVPDSEVCGEGVVTSVNDSYVFVRYGTNVGSSATRPADLSVVSQ